MLFVFLRCVVRWLRFVWMVECGLMIRLLRCIVLWWLVIGLKLSLKIGFGFLLLRFCVIRCCLRYLFLNFLRISCYCDWSLMLLIEWYCVVLRSVNEDWGVWWNVIDVVRVGLRVVVSVVCFWDFELMWVFIIVSWYEFCYVKFEKLYCLMICFGFFE